ncbi:MAG TPA: MBL fold metallo-hydrolase [Burkholderiaceae bacterium]|nr:MBL fold metallo-hydrolase [Burkholderiaceae bacterium]
MNPHEHELAYPFGDALPAPATRVEVAPGVWWLRMPLPFALDHINLWLLRDTFRGRDGWTLVDTGVSSDAIRGHWETLFASGLDGLPIVRVLCTHTHPDHVGLARMLCDRFDAPLWMTLGEYAMGRILSVAMPGADPDSAYRHYRRHGMAEGPQLEAVAQRGRRHFPSLVPEMPLWVRRAVVAETIRIGERDWRVIVGTGHSPERASLHCADDGLLISGDMVLPRISTNVSVFDLEPEANPLDWYLTSLRRFEPCATDTLVLPSHGRPFRGLHRRLAQLHAHHDERLAVVGAACRERAYTAAGMVPVLFGREFDAHQMMFALGESLAHLHSLWYAGKIGREVGADGVVRFGAA